MILVFSGTGYCAAASPGASTGNGGYWIHVDPVPDKYLNDRFVITGTTNIPMGEEIDIMTGLASSPHLTRYEAPVFWYREYTVPVREGTGENHTFATPPIDIVPSRNVEGTLETMRLNEDYYIVAEYAGNTSIEDGTVYRIRAPGALQIVTATPGLSGNVTVSTQTPATAPQKSPTSPALAVVAPGIAGACIIFIREKRI